MRFWYFQLTVATGAIAALALIPSAHGQETDRFEVASVVPNLSGEQNTQIVPEGGRLRVRNASLQTLIRNAYGLLDFQLAGGPGWRDSEMYDIDAKTAGDLKITPARMKPLLQNLLSDRFALKVHWETREMPVYALVVYKDGPKFKESTSTGKPGMNTRRGPGRLQMTGTKAPIAELASNLGFQLRHIVIDQTGLTGRVRFHAGVRGVPGDGFERPFDFERGARTAWAQAGAAQGSGAGAGDR